MAPVVHGFEREYAGRIDFVYLNVADLKTKHAQDRYSFEATPHFFFLRPDGTPVESMRGVIPADSMQRALERLINSRSR